ncbi:MAG: hypothetical protein EBY28_13480 [Betaproteobacteria bacterium]|nr:hypothetical protein [Betaproteobacteria bacterium]
MAGPFHWVHNIAIDTKGNLYTAEVDTGKYLQRFRPPRWQQARAEPLIFRSIYVPSTGRAHRADQR